MGGEPLVEDEARKMAYDMAFKRFESIENSIGDQWAELSTRQQRREIDEKLVMWKQGVDFRTIVAPVLKSIAKQLAESHSEGNSDDPRILAHFETELFEAFDAGAYDAQLGRERYDSLE
jgi:hypothetical protein